MNALRKYIKNPKIRQIIVLFQQHWGRMEIGRQSAEMAYYVLLALLPTMLLLGNIIPLLPLPREQVLAYVEMALPLEVSNTLTPILEAILIQRQWRSGFIRAGAVDLDGFESIQCLSERFESSLQYEDAEEYHRPQNLFVRDRLSVGRHDFACRFPVHVRQIYP